MVSRAATLTPATREITAVGCMRIHVHVYLYLCTPIPVHACGCPNPFTAVPCCAAAWCSTCRHSLHAISSQLSPLPGCTGIELLEADTFNLHCFQTLTGTKFVLIVEPNTSYIPLLLQRCGAGMGMGVEGEHACMQAGSAVVQLLCACMHGHGQHGSCLASVTACMPRALPR